MSGKDVSFAPRLGAKKVQEPAAVPAKAAGISRARTALRLLIVSVLVSALTVALHLGTRELRDQARKDHIREVIETSGVGVPADEKATSR